MQSRMGGERGGGSFALSLSLTPSFLHHAYHYHPLFILEAPMLQQRGGESRKEAEVVEQALARPVISERQILLYLVTVESKANTSFQ